MPRFHFFLLNNQIYIYITTQRNAKKLSMLLKLNDSYYKTLVEQYSIVDILPCEFGDKISALTFKIIMDNFKNKSAIHINFQNEKKMLAFIGTQLFVELANDIFCNSADFPPLAIGNKVRSKRPIGVGKPKPQYLDFEIIKIQNDQYTLENKKYLFNWKKSFTELVEKFIPVNQKAQNQTLTNFTAFFEELNGQAIHGFTPTYFDKKSVFIAPRTFWDSLKNTNVIPTVYIPNIREDNDATEKKPIHSIPALPDCLVYFTPKYETCYQKIVLSQKINTIVLFDTEEDKIPQILQDKNRFGFNLIILTSSINPLKNQQIPCWNWYKEEIQIVNSL